MKKLFIALALTCIGALIIQEGSRHKTILDPPKPTTYNVEAPQQTLTAIETLAPIEPVPVAVEPVETPQPIIPEQRPIIDNDAKSFIYQHESGNCPTKWQGERGPCPEYHGVPTDPNVGYGLCQSTPASKMAVMGPGWETSWELQDQWCTQYANNRYGGWQNAYYWWLQNSWW